MAVVHGFCENQLPDRGGSQAGDVVVAAAGAGVGEAEKTNPGNGLIAGGGRGSGVPAEKVPVKAACQAGVPEEDVDDGFAAMPVCSSERL